MKSFLCAIFFSCVLAVVSAQLCREQEECDETQCCAGLNPLMGGVCQNFTIEGGKCHLVDRIVPMFGEFYLGPCPCAEGLVCVQQGKKKNNGICQKPVVTTTAPVTDEGDASADEPAAEQPAAAPEAE
ncbi:unnamed protein product [Larinioides sclopetarius]|uniref:Prokineticin domain-containing protein n=1 Tax=Larinioides sclopetarius TaxID=280406 RepID=A0AAV2APN0_9ARAC